MNDNSRLETKKLTASDLSSIIEINLQHRKVMGLQKKDSYDDIFNKNVNTYFEQPNRYILGAFWEGKLISFVGVIRWKDLPFWTFANVKAKPFWGSNKFQPKLNGIATLISRVFNEEMRNQRTAYWFLTARKRSEGHRDYWSLFVPELIHYRFISRTIEKGYKPHDAFFWDLMGKQTWDEDLVIRIGIEKSKEEALMPFCKRLQIDDLLDPNVNLDTGEILKC